MNNTLINNKKNEIYEKKHTFKYNIRNQESILVQLRNLISNKTKIDKKIIYNLLKMEKIQNISNITIKKKNNEYIVEVPERILLKENYCSNTDYIFASFNLFDTNYDMKENFYINKLDKKISFYNSQFSNAIIKGKSYYNITNKWYGFYLDVSLNKKDMSYTNIELLTKDEKKELDKKIMNNLHSINKIKTIKNDINLINNKDFYKLEIYLISDLNIEFDKINQTIQNEINDIIKDIYLIIEKIKENNKDIFERALLEQEITNF